MNNDRIKVIEDGLKISNYIKNTFPILLTKNELNIIIDTWLNHTNDLDIEFFNIIFGNNKLDTNFKLLNDLFFNFFIIFFASFQILGSLCISFIQYHHSVPQK